MSPNPGGVPGPGQAPEQIFEVVDLDAGVEGWLVVDTTRSGLSFGGFRFSPQVSRLEVSELARAMTWKLAGHGLPVGGAKAGLRCDARDPDLVAKLRVFAQRCREPLLRGVMVGKDMGATDALLDALYGHLDVPQLHVVGRRRPDAQLPPRIRDLTGHCRHMTGLGVAWAVGAALGSPPEGARIAIQGFGLVGAGTAMRLAPEGARLVAVSDGEGMVAFREGFEPEELATRVERTGSIPRRALPPGSTMGPQEALFEAEADVLVLAANSHSVDENAARAICAPLVVEGANFGLTPAARQVLQERGITVVPDLIASSSSAAMVALQMASANGIPEKELWQRIRGSIEDHTRQAAQDGAREGTDLRTAYLRRVGAK